MSLVGDGNENSENNKGRRSLEPTKEKSENKVSQICYIYFLYHFDLGSKYLEDGVRFEEPKDNIKEKIGKIKKDLIKDITYNRKLAIEIPSYVKKVNPDEYRIDIQNLRIELKVKSSEQDKLFSSSQYGYDIYLKKAHMILFDTGVVTINLKFKLNFVKEIDSLAVYDAYENIYCEIKKSLNENEIESKKNSEEFSVLKEIHDTIKAIRAELQDGKEKLYTQNDTSTLSPMSLFWIPKMEWDKTKQFFSLLYLKPQLDDRVLNWKIQNNDQLREVQSTYCYYSNENHFICMYNAALLIDNVEKNIETYIGLLEISGYIWVAGYLLVDALEHILEEDDVFKVRNEGKKIEKIKNLSSEERSKEEERIEKINKLRSRSYYIQQIRYTALLSLSSLVEIFDKILEDAWQTDKSLFAKSHEQAEFLNSMFRSMYEDKQHELNSKLSNGLSLLQAMSIPLILFLTLLTLSNDSTICSINLGNPNPDTTIDTKIAYNAGNWCTNNNTLFWIMFIPFLLSLLICYIWYKKYLEIKVKPIKNR